MTTESTDAKLARMIEHAKERVSNYTFSPDENTAERNARRHWSDKLSLLLLVQTMGKALDEFSRLAEAKDDLMRFKGCAIPEAHEGDDSSVAMSCRDIIPFLPLRPQPYYITMRDACKARSALLARDKTIKELK